MDYAQIVEFHGHSCPGLAMGYRMACAALAELKSMRAEDEELVAIVENDACGVDALQCVTGCQTHAFGVLPASFGDVVEHGHDPRGRSNSP